MRNIDVALDSAEMSHADHYITSDSIYYVIHRRMFSPGDMVCIYKRFEFVIRSVNNLNTAIHKIVNQAQDWLKPL